MAKPNYDYINIFDTELRKDKGILENTIEERIELLRKKNIKNYRVKTIKSGNMLECEIYPIWRNYSEFRKRTGKKESRETQKNLNANNMQKRVVRLINTNFTNEDIWATYTYDEKHLPDDIKSAKKDMVNYIRRLKEHIKKYKLPKLKYIYVTESYDDGKKKRIHHHIIMNFSDRDFAEKLWDKGAYPQSRRLQPNDYGLEGIARYVSKEVKSGKIGKNTKSYCISRNLDKPIETVSDNKISKRQVRDIAGNENIAFEFFENEYSGYKYNDIAIRYSDYVNGAYMYVRMRRRE